MPLTCSLVKYHTAIFAINIWTFICSYAVFDSKVILCIFPGKTLRAFFSKCEMQSCIPLTQRILEGIFRRMVHLKEWESN